MSVIAGVYPAYRDSMGKVTSVGLVSQEFSKYCFMRIYRF
jgi:hypothetical protein